MKISIIAERDSYAETMEASLSFYSGLCQQDQRAYPSEGHHLVVTKTYVWK
jgi:hypothetical protein